MKVSSIPNVPVPPPIPSQIVVSNNTKQKSISFI